MDTSDSDCFESADEEIESDDEKRIKIVKTNINKLKIQNPEKQDTPTLLSEEPINISKDENKNISINYYKQQIGLTEDLMYTSDEILDTDSKGLTFRKLPNIDSVCSKRVVQTSSDNRKLPSLDITQSKEDPNSSQSIFTVPTESTKEPNKFEWEETDWEKEADKELHYEKTKLKSEKELSQVITLIEHMSGSINDSSSTEQVKAENKGQDAVFEGRKEQKTLVSDSNSDSTYTEHGQTEKEKTALESKKVQKTVLETKQQEVLDDDKSNNLWDDDEIDWESEGNKEEENIKMHSQEKTISDIKESKPNAEPAPKSQSHGDDKWEDSDWEPVDYDEKDITTSSELSNLPGSWSGWGNWGVSSILNTATQGVTTITSHVSHGLTTVLESGMGVPEPEEMARINKIGKEQHLKERLSMESQQEPEPTNFRLGNFGSLVSGVSHLTKFVESTSTKVISGGLDTLESIGKKTMEVLQEGDPGLKRKRAFLKLDTGKPVLSQVLREAKEKAEQENKQLEEKHITKKQKNYETLFDDHQGLVHLEALEMLSKLCTIKLQNNNETLTGKALIEMQETMEQVKELCELPEDEEDDNLTLNDIKEKLETAVNEINIKISYDKLLSTWEETDKWLSDPTFDWYDENEMHQQAIENLAQLTAMAVEQFHKAGELLLVKDHRSTADEADSLVQLTSTTKALILIVANKFTERINNAKSSDASNQKQINDLITNVFFEAANSSSYIQDAFQLLIPVLQVGAL